MAPESMRTAEEQIAESIDSTLLEQARRNELRIGYVRTVTLVLTSAVNLAAHLEPDERAPIRNFVLTAAFATASAIALVVLRRRYRPWLRFVMPFADAGLVLVLFLTTTRKFDPEYLRDTGVLVNLAMVCALLAVSGGLRLTRGAALLTTALGAAIFGLGTTLAGFGPVRTAFPMSFLLGAGLLGTWMTGIVRSSIESEVARTILSRFVPARVIEKAHKNPLSLITEPRSLDATIVVTDLRGFTSLAERVSPAEVLGFLNRVQGELAEIVQRRGGTVDKFMGDGMLAVFGAPEPQADHAARALGAVAEMVQAVLRIDREGTARVRIGIGVHSGEVVAGCLGSGVRLEFTVIGDTVNAASRLQSLTKDKGAVALVSEETLVRARAHSQELPNLEPIGEVVLRGRSQPLEVHRLTDPALPRSLFPDSLR
jgi:class 3 adenylate cyclase